MKKTLVFFIILGLLFSACSTQNESTQIQDKNLPVKEEKLPTENLPVVKEPVEEIIGNEVSQEPKIQEEVPGPAEVSLEKKETLDLKGKTPVIKVNYGSSDLLLIKLNSKTIFDSKTNPTGKSFDILTNKEDFISENNSITVEYTEVADDTKISVEFFLTEDATQNELNWIPQDSSGKKELPISYNSLI